MSTTQQTPIPPPRPTQPNKKKDKPSYKKHIGLMWFLYIIGIGSLALIFYGISKGWLGELPTFEQLESPESSLASEVYAIDGTMLGKFYIKDRTNAAYHEIPTQMIDALVATEDVRYYEHSGIDFRGIVRAVTNMAVGDNAGGGSTISQQLAKNLFHAASGKITERIKQKLKEWVIAVRLEKSYTKEEILTMYLNTVPFSHNTHGIKAASNVYFNTQADSLKVQEAAVLVGMLKASTKYNPKRNPEQSKERRNVVFAQMAKYNKITVAEKDSLQALPLELDFNRQTHNEGLATHFREYVKAEMKKWAKNNAKLNGEQYNIFKDGLKIYTTIDPTMQRYAESAVAEHMKGQQEAFFKHWKGKKPWKNGDYNVKANLKKSHPWYGTNKLIYNAVKRSGRYGGMKRAGRDEAFMKEVFEKPIQTQLFSWDGDIDTLISPLDSLKYTKYILHTGFMAMDPTNGHIKAWVGDINHTHFKYDNVKPSSKRQVGSTFKPFVYTLAVQNGWSPCHKLPNVAVTFDDFDGWTPENAGGSTWEGKMVTLRRGLASSINRITARIMQEITAEPVVALVKKMGIESHIDAYPSICLGTPDISVYEMVGAYSTFANKGFYTKPLAITRIEDKNGNTLQSFIPLQKEVIDDKTAYAMIHLLKGVADMGTAISLRTRFGLQSEIAGKTGTTNEHSDGWFIGMTPNLIAGGWVGGDEKAIRFRDLSLGSGSRMALPIWAKFFKKVYKNGELGVTENDRFKRPGNMNIELDCTKYEDFGIQNGQTQGTGTALKPVPGQPGMFYPPTAPGTQQPTQQPQGDYDYDDQFD